MKNLRNCISLRENFKSTNFWFVHLRAVLDRVCNRIEQNTDVQESAGADINNTSQAGTIYGEDRVIPWVVQGATMEIFQAARSPVPMRDNIVQFLDFLYSNNVTDELQSGLVMGLPSANN